MDDGLLVGARQRFCFLVGAGLKISLAQPDAVGDRRAATEQPGARCLEVLVQFRRQRVEHRDHQHAEQQRQHHHRAEKSPCRDSSCADRGNLASAAKLRIGKDRSHKHRERQGFEDEPRRLHHREREGDVDADLGAVANGPHLLDHVHEDNGKQDDRQRQHQ